MIRQRARRDILTGTIIGFLVATLLSIGLIMLFWWLGWLVGDVQTVVGTIGLWVVLIGVVYSWWRNWDQGRHKARVEELEDEAVEAKKRATVMAKPYDLQPGLSPVTTALPVNPATVSPFVALMAGSLPTSPIGHTFILTTQPKIIPEQQRLLDIMADMRRPIEERAQAGMRLAKIGDPRAGVGLREDGVPDIVWCQVPDEGRTPIGDTHVGNNHSAQKVRIPDFWIAKYPITYRQFQAFIDDKGFEDDQWWEAGDNREAYNQEYKYWNHPRECITWYAAMAYCKWLSAKLGDTVRLPIDKEWEKAARGRDGRKYPWGDKYVSGYANIDETQYKWGPHYLEQTSTVGIYPPESASPYGVMDMMGNVAEWTLSAYYGKDEASELQAGRTLHDISNRVLCGGSWSSNAYQEMAKRAVFDPKRWTDSWGFRVVHPLPL